MVEPNAPFEKVIRECLSVFKGRVKQCAFYAFHHLEKAERIAEVDPEMAAFRAITAEEEAATALFFSLRERQYSGARKIQYRSHLYKLGLYQFLASIKDYFASMANQFPELRLRKITTKLGEPRIVWEAMMPGGRWLQSVPPLHLKMSDLHGQPYHFDRQIEAMKTDAAQRDLKKYLESIANLRNELLYANEAGRPGIVGDLTEVLEEQRKRVKLIFILVCMIHPYSEKAFFVQQCLNAFLFMMGKVDEQSLKVFDYDNLTH